MDLAARALTPQSELKRQQRQKPIFPEIFNYRRGASRRAENPFHHRKPTWRNPRRKEGLTGITTHVVLSTCVVDKAAIMPTKIRLSDQQYQIVQALQAVGEGSAKDVREQIRHLNLAHTTIATVLSRLEKKGYLTSDVKGRERIYRCLVDKKTVQRSMVSSLVSTLFNGDPRALLTHLVREGEIGSCELDELRDMLQAGEEQ